MTIETKKRQQYSDAFKSETVSLVIEQGYSVSKAADAVGTSAHNVRRWKREFEQEASGDRLTRDEREELARLRRENKELRMEKEILKKASAFFATHMR